MHDSWNCDEMIEGRKWFTRICSDYWIEIRMRNWSWNRRWRTCCVFVRIVHIHLYKYHSLEKSAVVMLMEMILRSEILIFPELQCSWTWTVPGQEESKWKWWQLLVAWVEGKLGWPVECGNNQISSDIATNWVWLQQAEASTHFTSGSRLATNVRHSICLFE